jgi:hypothetical protein
MRHLSILGLLLALAVGAIGPATAAGPALSVAAPKEGAVIDGDMVRVEFSATDFEIVASSVPVSDFGKRPDANRLGQGHVHIVLDAQPLVVWFSADPYTFENIAPGEHQLMVELVNNDHSSLAPKVMQLIRFRLGPSALPQTGAGPAMPEPGEPLLLVCAILLMLLGRVAVRRAAPRD